MGFAGNFVGSKHTHKESNPQWDKAAKWDSFSAFCCDSRYVNMSIFL